jgi:hypothetical protein
MNQRYLIWPVEDGYVVRDTIRDHEVISESLPRREAQAEARRLNNEADPEVTIPRCRGSKWLREAKYIDNALKREVVRVIELCKQEFPDEPVMIRPASYIGPDDDSRVVVCYGLGQRIFRSV